MKNILSKKDSGMLDQILPVLVGIFALTLVFALMLGTMESIQTKNKVDLVARRAILLLETYGYIDDSSEAELLQQLAESNVENAVITTNGYSQTSQSWGAVDVDHPAAYGQKVEVVITGKTQASVTTTDSEGWFSTLFEKQDMNIQVVRVSTSKN